MKNAYITTILLGLVTAGLLVGCGGDKPDQASSDTKAALPAGMIVQSAPAGVKPIAELKKTAKKGDTIVIQGLIGGSKKPFVSDWATLTIVDVKHPNICLQGKCGCKTPWDYCCDASDKTPHMATIQIVDANGKPLKGTLQGVGGLEKLGVLTVEGTVHQLNGNTLIVNAAKLHCKPLKPKNEVPAACGGCPVSH